MQVFKSNHDTEMPPKSGDLRWVDPTTIATHPMFDSLFRFDEERCEKIKNAIQVHGYDKAYPIVVWLEKNTRVKGNHRHKACLILDCDVFVLYKSYSSFQEAINDALHEEGTHRNNDDAEQMQCIFTLYQTTNYKKYATLLKNNNELNLSKTDLKKLIAGNLGIGEKKVQQCFTIIENNKEFPDLIDKILKKKTSINSAYQQIKKETNVEDSKYTITKEDYGFYLDFNNKHTQIIYLNPALQQMSKFKDFFKYLETEIEKIAVKGILKIKQ